MTIFEGQTPPPFWQCQDFERYCYSYPSLMVQKKEDETLRSADKTTYFHKYFQLLVMNPMMGPWGAEKELD